MIEHIIFWVLCSLVALMVIGMIPYAIVAAYLQNEIRERHRNLLNNPPNPPEIFKD